MTRQPLRFRISSWRQLTECKSNNSSELFIRVTDFIHDNRLSGLRIKVEHRVFGVLFACLVDASGGLISKNSSTNTIHEFTPAQIIEELAKFGFLVEYNPEANLSGDQLQYLMTLRDLHYDKIRHLPVWEMVNGVQQFSLHVVAFNADKNGDWLNNGYAPSKAEFLEALSNGSAINISAISESRKYNWTWLVGFVANIEDVLKDNAEVRLCQ